MPEPKNHLLNSANWEIWYQDTFDLACPRRLERSGQGLINGLMELWARHLFETIQPGGTRGFSRFNLWWQQGAYSITITGDPVGQEKLRSWMFGEQRINVQNYRDCADQNLLALIAEAHSKLILNDQTSDLIFAKSRRSIDKKEFINQIKAQRS